MFDRYMGALRAQSRTDRLAYGVMSLNHVYPGGLAWRLASRATQRAAERVQSIEADRALARSVTEPSEHALRMAPDIAFLSMRGRWDHRGPINYNF